MVLRYRMLGEIYRRKKAVLVRKGCLYKYSILLYGIGLRLVDSLEGKIFFRSTSNSVPRGVLDKDNGLTILLSGKRNRT